jgi:hypothetical protein
LYWCIGSGQPGLLTGRHRRVWVTIKQLEAPHVRNVHAERICDRLIERRAARGHGSTQVVPDLPKQHRA